jgi:hypothetical protein
LGEALGLGFFYGGELWLVFVVFVGFWGKAGRRSWCFDGEFVVNCVVERGELMVVFLRTKNAPRILDLFFVVPL